MAATWPAWLWSGAGLLPALVVGGAAYVGLAVSLRVREISEVIDQVRRRIGR
ncbi:hypothetical protein [Fodinicola acaciae]|uniref:hypothetical protein n=1 Tax=Fodinicola acaciae TaxID=2681555 RepID=UPI0013D4D404|nr:hypothetical protein [Fodinicola acaciae]